MITRNDDVAKISSQSLLFNDAYIFEMSGLWRVINAKMGGAFVSISTYNEATTEILTIEGYVYAPNYDKDQLLREVKAVLYSFKINSSNL